MRMNPVMPLIVIACCAWQAPLAAQEKSAPEAKKVEKAKIPENVKQGYDLIHDGKIVEALAVFKKIRAEEPDNKRAKKAIRPLTQAVQLEKIVAMDKHAKWMSAADWLNSFYTANKVPTKRLALAERVYARFPNDKKWGNRYALALAAANQGKKAVAVYEGLLKKHPAADIQVMTAVLYARQGNAEKAMMHVGKLPEKLSHPSVVYNLACVYALMGNLPKAGELLGRSFELTPPSKLAKQKKQAKADPDLARLMGSEELVAAMKSTSKVGEPKAKSACKDCGSSDSCSDKDKEGCSEEGKDGCTEDEHQKKEVKK